MSVEKDLPEFETPTAALNAQGMYVLMDDIESDSVRPVIEWILHENYVRKRRHKELLLMLCSGGGDLGSAFALIDVMRSSKIPIKTVGLGAVSSSGLLIFMAGAQGRRVLTPNTSILSHQFSWGTDGKMHELFATLKEFELTQTRMIEHYRRCTQLDDATIRQILLPPQDVWLSAQEALQYRICDHVAELG